jgi:transcriptional regulator with PAS, ATPase and Fis domain
MVARSSAMKNVLRSALKVAEVDVNVVLLGESGVGKSHLARWIHQKSPRRDGPFIEVNCGAIPEPLFESEFFGYEAGAFTGAHRKGKMGLAEMAEGGTLFLDEVAELSPLNQVKLLKFIQEKQFYRVGGTRLLKVDCRIIAATNQDLKALVQEKRFREDLYFRLHVVPIAIPPLRERREDVLPLIEQFLEFFSRKYHCEKKLDGAAMMALSGHDWPGNVRELMNTLEQLVVTSSTPLITAEDLPAHLRERPESESVWDGSKTLSELLEEVERQALIRARQRCRTTVEMARALGISQPSVVRKMKKYAIE